MSATHFNVFGGFSGIERKFRGTGVPTGRRKNLGAKFTKESWKFTPGRECTAEIFWGNWGDLDGGRGYLGSFSVRFKGDDLKRSSTFLEKKSTPPGQTPGYAYVSRPNLASSPLYRAGDYHFQTPSTSAHMTFCGSHASAVDKLAARWPCTTQLFVNRRYSSCNHEMQAITRSYSQLTNGLSYNLSTQLREWDITLGQFRQALKTHLFGHWQLQRRVTVFFVRCVQIHLLTYLSSSQCTSKTKIYAKFSEFFDPL